jgi:transcription termination factor Rho
MSVLDRDALQASPLADLHAIASELSIDGYRRLRRPELIDAILAQQSGQPLATADSEEDVDTPPSAEEEPAPARRRRGRRGGRGRDEAEASAEAASEAAEEASEPEAAAPESEAVPEGEAASEPELSSEPAREEEAEETRPSPEDVVAEGVVELLPNGSGFVRVDPPEPSDDDVYISAAQVKRCELVSGDRVSGPRRAPRRSERFASLVRIDTINDRPAEELADSARFDDLPVSYPQDRFRFGSEDPTVKAIEWLTPIGRGSRVTIVGASGAGKTEALRRLAAALAAQDELVVSLALAGARPEEVSAWAEGPVAPAGASPLGSSSDAQAHSVELVIDQGRRVAARGAHAVVLIDTLDGLHHAVARKALAAARNIVDGGSLTVIATAAEAIGGETTVIALDRRLASTGRFPALDLVASNTIRTELLVGDAGAEAIARARAEALDAD